MSMNRIVGAKLMQAMQELYAEIEHLRLKRSALREAWEKWDIDELLRMEFITQAEYDALKAEQDRLCAPKENS
jgi:hypothetical protein